MASSALHAFVIEMIDNGFGVNLSVGAITIYVEVKDLAHQWGSSSLVARLFIIRPPLFSTSIASENWSGSDLSYLVTFSEQEQGVDPFCLCYMQPGICAHHHECSCPRVGCHTAIRYDRNRGHVILKGTAAPRIHRMAEGLISDLHPVAIVATGAIVAFCNSTMPRASRRL